MALFPVSREDVNVSAEALLAPKVNASAAASAVRKILDLNTVVSFFLVIEVPRVGWGVKITIAYPILRPLRPPDPTSICGWDAGSAGDW
jgi:hypothetical protein